MVVRAILCGIALATAGAAMAGPGAQAGSEAADAARRLQAGPVAGVETARNDIDVNGSGAATASDSGDERSARPCRDNQAMKALGRMSRQTQPPCI